MKLVSASSLTDSSQGLLHVNKIVKHLIWHLLPLNIHKLPSTGKHLLHCSSLTEPLKIWCARDLLLGTTRKLHAAAFSSETLMACTKFINCLVCKHGSKPNKANPHLVTHVSTILLHLEGVNRKAWVFYLEFFSQTFPFPLVKKPNSERTKHWPLFNADHCDQHSSSVRGCEMGNGLPDNREKENAFFGTLQTLSYVDGERNLIHWYTGETMAVHYFLPSDTEVENITWVWRTVKNLPKDVVMVDMGLVRESLFSLFVTP